MPHQIHSPRNISLPLLPRVKAELNRLQNDGIISPVTEPTDWCAGMVVVPKKDSSVRICVDFTHLNHSVRREKHHLPSVDEILGQLSGGKIFSKVDAKSGFHQIELAEKSKLLTTFITPFGRFCFNRLPFGISSAPEHFFRRMTEILVGMEGVVCEMDDILIFGSNQLEHDSRVHKVLNTLKKNKLTLNAEKCEFSKKRVKFLGHILDGYGVHADPEKVAAIRNMETPKNVSDIRRFLGMVNQLGKFSSDIAEHSKPLRELLLKKNLWCWTAMQQKSFDNIKDICCSQKILAFYDPNLETIVSSDASSYGMGSVLLQKQKDEKWRPVMFASRVLSETEQRYAQIEKESLAVTWSCEKFAYYLVGKHFTIHTDHKPLVSLLGSKRMDELPPRILRFRIRLMRFSYTVEHIPGKNLVIADTLSRAPLPSLSNHDREQFEETETSVSAIINEIPASEAKLDEIRRHQSEDPVCRKVMQYAEFGWPDIKKLQDCERRYYRHRNELTVQQGLLMFRQRLVIPSAMRLEILGKIHEGHLGIVKCRERAKTSVWWPSISKQIDEIVKSCVCCAEYSTNRAEPLMPIKRPDRPWKKVGTDLFQFRRQIYLLVVDYFSRWVEFSPLRDTTSSNVINRLKVLFARYGIPETLVSDNGPQYKSEQFNQFMEEYDISHITSSPRYPMSNGEAERAVQTVKSLLSKCRDPHRAMLAYRSTRPQKWLQPVRTYVWTQA